MMRVLALSMGAVVAIATGLNATAFATNQGAENNQNSKEYQTKELVKNEDGHTLTQKWLKVSDKSKVAFYHFNEVKDTDQELYNTTSKEDRHYQDVSTTRVTVNDETQTSKRVVVYNINKNKTICNIVEHSDTGVTKDGDCSNIQKVEDEPKKDNCKDEKKDDSTPVVPNTDGDNEEVKEETKEQPKVEVKTESTNETVKVTPDSTKEADQLPESLPVTGASPINGTLIALLAAVATFIGYASSLALMEYRLKD